MVSPKAKKDKIDGKKMFICDRHQKINLEREREIMLLQEQERGRGSETGRKYL